MASFLNDNDDLLFYLERGIDWAPIVEATELGYRAQGGFKNPQEAVETYRDVLNLYGELAAERIAPHVAEIDREGVIYKDGEAYLPKRLQSIFDELKSLELHGLCLPRELGGQNMPLTLFYLASELLGRADISVMAHNSFHGAMAMAMLVYSLHEGSTKYDVAEGKIVSTRWAKEIEEIRSGKSWGSMDITEPDAGSDMAALRTVGEQDEHGNWFVTGQKIFITSGHGKYHFVIARTEKNVEGLEALSMFLVNAYEDDEHGKRTRIATLDRLEEKLGHHGSATAALTYERSPAQLIGKRGEGFKLMLVLMNNARIGVGFESIGLCEASYRLAKAYAAERKSMGKTIDRHEMIADFLDEMESDIEGIRALAVNSAVSEELSAKTSLWLEHGFYTGEEAERKTLFAARHRHRARRFTPLLKYLASEKSVEMARRGIQIHGGVGYTKEFGAEKILRDAMVMPIYEGTSQIQSLMAMKDTLGGAMKNPSRFAKKIAMTRLRAASARDPLERRVAKLQVTSLQVQQHLIARTAADKARALKGAPFAEWPQRFMKDWDPKRDFAFAMLHAERLARILADEAVCEVLLEQVQAHPDRRPVLERYLERAEPRTRAIAEVITTTGNRLLEKLERTEGENKREVS